MLAGHIPISDPDLQPRQHNNAPYREMIEAVLRHSEGLFDRGDSGELLRDELMQSTISSSDPSITAWWSIAAARLDRRSAGKILHDALPRFSGSLWKADRARIVATLWELGNASEKGFVLNWFYREPPVICGGGSPQQIFLESAATAQGGWPRLESLLADPRFDFLDRVSLAWLVNTVNQRSNPPIISGHELMQACSSDETDQLRVTVARWRKKTRASAPTWGRPGKRWTPPAM
jgi:hypothetical protein